MSSSLKPGASPMCHLSATRGLSVVCNCKSITFFRNVEVLGFLPVVWTQKNRRVFWENRSDQLWAVCRTCLEATRSDLFSFIAVKFCEFSMLLILNWEGYVFSILIFIPWLFYYSYSIGVNSSCWLIFFESWRILRKFLFQVSNYWLVCSQLQVQFRFYHNLEKNWLL